MSANVYIIAGPNGAGKTTFAREFLPNYADCRNFINADLIAEGIAPFSPRTAAVRAGRLMLEEISRSMKRVEDFGFETTLSGRSYLNLMRKLKKRGYGVHIFYLWVPTVELSLGRIRERVLSGGHDVPETVVRRRFERSIRNFLVNYRPLADSWTLYDNTGGVPQMIASKVQDNPRIVDARLYNELMETFGNP